MPEPGAAGTGRVPQQARGDPAPQGSRSNRVIVFAGPCLPQDPDPAWRRLLERVDLRPPARRGDVLAAVAEAPRAVVLLDGYYYTVPSVTHKELLYALRAGVPVVGAASMGALRAVELAPHGMVGVGRIYEWFAAGTLDGDDEVALLHGPEEEGYPPLTLALVEVRWALETLVGTGEVDAGRAGDLIAAVRALPFTRRHLSRVLQRGQQVLGPEGAGALARALKGVSLKAADARLALEVALNGEGKPPAARIASGESAQAATGPAELPVTLFLNTFREESFRHPGHGDGAPGPTLLATWRTAAALHPQAPELVHRLRLRYLLASAATAAEIPPLHGRVEELCERLRKVLAARRNGPLLPAGELREEAGLQARAEAAVRDLGGPAQALSLLADTLGLTPAQSGAELSTLTRAGLAAVPAWCFARAVLLTPAYPAAAEATRAAADIHRCFRRWSGDRRIALASLHRTAAALWGCPEGRVPREAWRRSLGGGAFRPALELLAPAQGLPEAINAYPEARATLRSRVLRFPLELSDQIVDRCIISTEPELP